MKSYAFKKALSNYIAAETSRLHLLESFKMNKFKKIAFSTRDINGKACERWSQELREAGACDLPVLYYFLITGEFNADSVCNTIRLMKESLDQTSRAMPKINDRYVSNISKVLYVGKTQRNFVKRFKEHLGFGNASTYALHLAHWSPRVNLDLELNYSCIEKCHIESLESVESAIHSSMKPLLGRSGR